MWARPIQLTWRKGEDEEGQADHSHPVIVGGAVPEGPLEVTPGGCSVFAAATVKRVLLVVLDGVCAGGRREIALVVAVAAVFVQDAVFTHATDKGSEWLKGWSKSMDD